MARAIEQGSGLSVDVYEAPGASSSITMLQISHAGLELPLQATLALIFRHIMACQLLACRCLLSSQTTWPEQQSRALVCPWM